MTVTVSSLPLFKIKNYDILKIAWVTPAADHKTYTQSMVVTVYFHVYTSYFSI